MRYFIVLILAICLCGSLAFGDAKLVDKVPIKNLPLISGNEELAPSPTMNARITPSMNLVDDPAYGEVDTVGTTWYDYQHNGTAGRMIRLDATGQVHVVWMNGLDNGATQRHIYYNLLTSGGTWSWPGVGTPVESANRGGYSSLGINADGYPFPCFHVVTPLSNPDAHQATAADFFPGTGAFSFWELPYVYEGGLPMEIIWPKIDVDMQGRLQIVGTENPRSQVAGDPQRIYYCRGEFDPIAFNITYLPALEEIDWVEVIAADIAASRQSNRVALVYNDIKYDIIPPHDTTQYNNDTYLVISEDGITWDFTNPINVTSFIDPDLGLLPDTLAADKDTFRVYTDASVVFDASDNIHVAFTTPAYYAIEGLISINNSLIWHWDETNQWYSLVADGWWGGVPFTCGAWQRFVQRPCLAVDESNNYMYMTYMHYDTADVSQGGFPQGEVMVSVSTDGGVRWAEATNITETHAPQAEPNHCWSERDITVNPTVEDGYLHILYVMDTDAGGIPQDEGSWTNSPVYYHKVSVNDIATSPLMPMYPLHVDSTGFPYTAVELVEGPEVPKSFCLSQNYPNPFNPTTNIRFTLTNTERVELKVYNITGQEVATLVDGSLAAGTYEVPFDASELASGVYFYNLSSPTQAETRKMVLLK